MGIFSQLTATNFASAGVCASGAIIFSTPLLLLFSPLCDGLSVFGGENVCWVACTQVPFYVGGDFRCWHFRYVERIIVRLSPFSISSFFREIALAEMRNIDRRPLFFVPASAPSSPPPPCGRAVLVIPHPPPLPACKEKFHIRTEVVEAPPLPAFFMNYRFFSLYVCGRGG